MPNALIPSTAVTSRDPKGAAFIAKVAAAYDKAKLSEAEAQRIHEAPIADLLRGFFADHRSNNRYAGEWVKPKYGYPQEYKGFKPVEEQIKAIAKIFRLSPDKALEFNRTVLANRPLDPLAEGRMVMISPFAFGTYCGTAEAVFTELAKSRKKVGDVFYNYREGEIVPERFRLSEATRLAHEQISKEQKGAIWIIDAQVGKRHAGKSPRFAVDCFEGNEFGLDLVAAGSHAIVHPERFKRFEELDMDLPGTETAPGEPGAFDYVSYLQWDDGLLEFDRRRVDGAHGAVGSASGFLSH